MKHYDMPYKEISIWNKLTISKEFLIFHNYNFYLITHYGEFDNLDAKSDLIRNLTKGKLYIADDFNVIYENNGRMNFDESLKNERLRGLNLKRYVREINYFYYTSTKPFVITTKTKYIQLFINKNLIKSNYTKAIKYLSLNGYSHLLDDLKKLYELNQILSGINIEFESIKNIEHLIKSIKNESKH